MFNKKSKYLTSCLGEYGRMFTYNAKWTWELELNSLCIASRVESTIADGHYKIVPESEGEAQEGEVNVIDVSQAPQDPKTNFAQEGKPWSIT